MLQQPTDSEGILLEGIRRRVRLYTCHESFDQYFGIMSGTASIMYIQNQTFADPMVPLIDWLTHDVNPTEKLLLVTTYADPISITHWCERHTPQAFKTFVECSLKEKFYWIDMFTYRGFGEHERGAVQIGYGNQIKQLGGNPDVIISPSKPDDLQSVDGLPAAIQNISSAIHGKGTLRMIFAYVDDFVDGVGPHATLNYLRRLINLMRKFGHTLILLMGWRSTIPEFHTTCERMVDQVLRWGYGDVPGVKQPAKFLQILKTTAPDELVNYLKVPYTMRSGKPIVGLATPLEHQGRAVSHTNRQASRSKRK